MKSMIAVGLMAVSWIHLRAENGRSTLGRPVTSREATIDSTQEFDFTSKLNHEGYRVKVFIPSGKPPSQGFPALYLLDGNVLFGTFAGAMRNESQAGEIEPAVIIGIESASGVNGADRTYDFTAWDLSPREKEIVVDLGSNPKFGGYDGFYQTIEEEVKPRVEQLVRLDEKRSSIFGWSLGGLFVVHTMLVHPNAFDGYAALSPALWRGDKKAFSEVSGFEAAVAKQNLCPRLFVGVGGLEDELSTGMLSWHVDQQKLAAEIKYGQMVQNAEQFAHLLEPFFRGRKLEWSFELFRGETHNSVPWTAVNPVLDFLFAPRETGQ